MSAFSLLPRSACCVRRRGLCLCVYVRHRGCVCVWDDVFTRYVRHRGVGSVCERLLCDTPRRHVCMCVRGCNTHTHNVFVCVCEWVCVCVCVLCVCSVRLVGLCVCVWVLCTKTPIVNTCAAKFPSRKEGHFSKLSNYRYLLRCDCDCTVWMCVFVCVMCVCVCEVCVCCVCMGVFVC